MSFIHCIKVFILLFVGWGILVSSHQAIALEKKWDIASLPATKEELKRISERIQNQVIPVDSKQLYDQIEQVQAESEELFRLQKNDRKIEFQNRIAVPAKNFEKKIKMIQEDEDSATCESDKPFSKEAFHEMQRELEEWINWLQDALLEYGKYVNLSETEISILNTPFTNNLSKCNETVSQIRQAGKAIEEEYLTAVGNIAAIENAKLDNISALVRELSRYEKRLREKHKPVADTLADKLWWIIGILAGFSILFILSIRLFETEIQEEFVKSGQLIQLITVMIILIVLMALGLAKILEEKTLGTLLGGLAGYVLSQGVGRSAAYSATQKRKNKKKKKKKKGKTSPVEEGAIPDARDTVPPADKQDSTDPKPDDK